MSTKHRPPTWFMCFNPYPEGTKPTVRHADLATARDEALRLCRSTGRKIHVLKVVGTAHPPKPPEPYFETRPPTISWDATTPSLRWNTDMSSSIPAEVCPLKTEHSSHLPP